MLNSTNSPEVNFGGQMKAAWSQWAQFERLLSDSLRGVSVKDWSYAPSSACGQREWVP
jgi:hypothetical protein